MAEPHVRPESLREKRAKKTERLAEKVLRAGGRTVDVIITSLTHFALYAIEHWEFIITLLKLFILYLFLHAVAETIEIGGEVVKDVLDVVEHIVNGIIHGINDIIHAVKHVVPFLHIHSISKLHFDKYIPDYDHLGNLKDFCKAFESPIVELFYFPRLLLNDKICPVARYVWGTPLETPTAALLAWGFFNNAEPLPGDNCANRENLVICFIINLFNLVLKFMFPMAFAIFINRGMPKLLPSIVRFMADAVEFGLYLSFLFVIFVLHPERELGAKKKKTISKHWQEMRRNAKMDIQHNRGGAWDTM